MHFPVDDNSLAYPMNADNIQPVQKKDLVYLQPSYYYSPFGTGM